MAVEHDRSQNKRFIGWIEECSRFSYTLLTGGWAILKGIFKMLVELFR